MAVSQAAAICGTGWPPLPYNVAWLPNNALKTPNVAVLWGWHARFLLWRYQVCILAQSPAIWILFAVLLTPSKKIPQKFLKLVHDRPFPHLFPNLDCQNVSVRPFVLPANFTFHFAFTISLFIFHCLCRVLHLQSAQEHMDGRTLDSGSHSHSKTIPWTTNCPEQGCPTRDPWPHVSIM